MSKLLLPIWLFGDRVWASRIPVTSLYSKHTADSTRCAASEGTYLLAATDGEDFSDLAGVCSAVWPLWKVRWSGASAEHLQPRLATLGHRTSAQRVQKTPPVG